MSSGSALLGWLLTCSVRAQNMVDINSFFYDDFPIEEIKSLPKLAADKMGWINCLPSQVQEVLAQ